MKEDERRRTAYFEWINVNNIKSVRKADEKKVVFAATFIGLPIKSVFTETDPWKVRLICSEIVLKRDSFEQGFFSDYLAVVRFLTTYAEFLSVSNIETSSPVPKSKPESKRNKKPEKKTGEQEKLKDSLTVAYYLSRVNSNALKKLGYSSWSLAFKKLGELLGQKPATIKNMRDEFDPYFENGRAGWYQKPLSTSRKEVFDLYAAISDSELEAIVLDILNNQSGGKFPAAKTSQNQREHQRIVIKSDTMKEVKSRKGK